MFKILRKIIALTVLILMLVPFAVYAGDTDMSIKSGDQDAFIIGKITGYEDSIYSVHVEKTLMGEVDSTDIYVEKPKYSPDLDNSSVDHYYALSLDKKDTLYEIKFGGYKADSADYKTLKLEYANSDPGNVSTRIQEFINSGKFVEADKKAKERKSKKSNSQTVSVPSTNQENAFQSSATTTKFAILSSSYAVWIIVATIACISSVLMFIKLKKPKNM